MNSNSNPKVKSDTRVKNRDLILGCDPGFKGAISILDQKTKKLIDVIDMPIRIIKEKNEIDFYKLGRFVDFYADNLDISVIEDVGVMTGKEGRSSMFRFGEGVGIVKGVLGSYGIPIFEIKPQIWKPLLRLTRDKRDSLEMARKLFPDQLDKFELIKHEGRAEAALLSYFGLRFGKK